MPTSEEAPNSTDQDSLVVTLGGLLVTLSVMENLLNELISHLGQTDSCLKELSSELQSKKQAPDDSTTSDVLPMTTKLRASQFFDDPTES